MDRRESWPGAKARSTAGWCGAITVVGSVLVALGCFWMSFMSSLALFGEQPTRKELRQATASRVTGAVVLVGGLLVVLVLVAVVRTLARHGRSTTWLPAMLLVGWVVGFAAALAIVDSRSISNDDKVVAAAAAWFTVGAVLGPLVGCLAVWARRYDITVTSVAR